MDKSTAFGPAPAPLPDGVRREVLLHDQKYTVTRVHIAKGVVSTLHDHPHTQVVYVLSGHGALNIGDRSLELGPEQCAAIEPNVCHCFQPPEEDISCLEFFVPGREDIVQEPCT